jgi:disulfide bond formation protein DsbB
MNAPDLARMLNSLGLLAISAVLAIAFADQFTTGDLPCPLCILQRVGFGLAGFGLAANVLFGVRTSHYALVILGACTGATAAVRQTFLHIAPGTGSYGKAFFGAHLYSWASVIFIIMVLGTALLLLWDRQFDRAGNGHRRPRALAAVAVGLFALLMLGNGLSTFAECTTGLCPDNPTGYLLFESGAP